MQPRCAPFWSALLLLLCTTGAQAQSDPPRQGLMWNRTGLPAVFPLQIKTLTGQDYVLLLSDVETGADALAAYINGGQFFRVLVPPGTFRVRFASGITWQGEEAMFGRFGQTEVIELPDPLTFEVVGLRRKAGHLIDLTTVAPGEVTRTPTRALHICQFLALAGDAPRLNERDEADKRYRSPPHSASFDIRSRYCWPT